MSSTRNIPVTFLAVLGLLSLITVSYMLQESLVFLVLMTCVIGLGLYTLWNLIHALFLGVEDPASKENDEALRARRLLVADKETALKVLQELEFDRSLGRITEDDYKSLSGPVKQEALVAIRKVDEEESRYRGQIEAELQKRIGGTVKTPKNDKQETIPEKGQKKKKRDDSQETIPEKGQKKPASSLECSSCQQPNDSDAKFCKHCGAHMVKEQSA